MVSITGGKGRGVRRGTSMSKQLGRMKTILPLPIWSPPSVDPRSQQRPSRTALLRLTCSPSVDAPSVVGDGRTTFAPEETLRVHSFVYSSGQMYKPESMPTGEEGWDRLESQVLTHKSHPEDWRSASRGKEIVGNHSSSEYVGPTEGWYPAPPCEPDEVSGVYLVQAHPSGRVKIGYSANVDRRLRSLQTGSPEQLKLVSVLDLDRAGENEIHKRFMHLRVHGEWFEPEVLDLLDEYPRV